MSNQIRILQFWLLKPSHTYCGNLLPYTVLVSNTLLKAVVVVKYTHAECLVWVVHWVLTCQTGIANLCNTSTALYKKKEREEAMLFLLVSEISCC